MKTKILVVEDHPADAEQLTGSLEAHGYKVLTARTGMDALNTARWALPDLILIDLMLEDMDGFSVCDILRHQPSTATTPIIVMSALAGEMARGVGVGSGVDDFVSKPVGATELLPRMEALLAASRAVQQTMVGETSDTAWR